MSDKVTMTAKDTFHASNVQADNLVEGDVFHCSETDAKVLERRGLAERMAGDLRNNLVHGTGFPRKRARSTRAEVPLQRR